MNTPVDSPARPDFNDPPTRQAGEFIHLPQKHPSNASMMGIQVVRNRLVNKIIVYMTFLSLLGIAVSLSRISEYGWNRIYLLHLGLVSLLIGCAILRKRLPYALKAFCVLGILFIFGAAGLLNFGLVGGGSVALVMFALMTAVLFGTRAGLIACAIDIVIVLLVGAAVCTETVTFSFDFSRYAVSPEGWGASIIVFLFYVPVLILAFGATQSHMTTSHHDLSEREVQYRLLFESANEAIFLIEDNIFLDCNEATLRMFGCDTKSDIIGHSPSDFSPKTQPDGQDSLQKTLPIIKNVLDGQRQRFEWKHSRKNGSLFDAEVSLNRVMLGEKTYIQAVVRDITDRKQAEDAQRQSDAFIKLVMDNLPVGIAVNSVNPAVTFSYMNDNFPKFYRTTREALADPDRFWEAVYEEPVFREQIKKRVLEDCASGDPNRMKWMDVPITRKGSETTYITAMNTPIPDKQLMISIVWDITDRKRTEEALCHEQELVSRIMETSPVGITAVNRHGEITFANACAEKILGLSRDELTKRTYNAPNWCITDYEGNTFPEEMLPFQQVKSTGLPVYDIRHAIQRTDGQQILLSINAAPVFSPANKFEGMVATVEDVTDRVRAQKALQESEMRFHSLFNAMSEGVALHELVTDKDGKAVDYRIVDVNPAYAVHTGLQIEQVRNQLAGELYKTDSPPYLELYAHVAQTGAPMFFETYFPKLEKYFDISVFSPKTDWFATVFTDISLRRKTQQQLRASEEKFMKAFQNNPAAMSISTVSEGRFLEVNEQFLDTLGFHREDVIGKTSLELDLFADYQQRTALVKILNEKGFVRNFEATVRTCAGDIRSALFSADFINLQNDMYMLSMVIDITELKKAREQLQQHQANMAHLQRVSELGELTSGLAHEINQPLCAIENYAQACLRLMEAKMDSARLTDAIKEIRNQAERAGKIVHRVKGMVRKKPPHFEFIRIKDIIQGAVDMMDAEAKKKEIRIVLDILEDLPPVYADSILIEQVIINLVHNAFEAMSDPGMSKKELTVRVKAGLNSTIEVSVSDTGCGIPEANMKKIFESFFSTKTEGLGIGLPLSKAIIESHTGQIWADTNTDGGAVFHFTLPTRSRTDEV